MPIPRDEELHNRLRDDRHGHFHAQGIADQPIHLAGVLDITLDSGELRILRKATGDQGEIHRVTADIRAGKLSPTRAEELYGVVIDTRGVVDEAATARRRQGMRSTDTADRIGRGTT